MAQPGNPGEPRPRPENGPAAGGSPREKGQGPSGRRRPLRRVLVPLLTIVLVVAISVGLYLARHEIVKLKEYAYAGVFVVSLLTNATVIVPVPGIVAFVPLLQTLNPVLVGIAGAAGGSIGEITGWTAGYSGGKLAKRSRLQTRVRWWMRGRRGGWVLFLFAAGPLPVDVAGVVAGALRYPLWRFLLIVWVGKTIKYIALMLLASLGIDWLMRWVDLLG